MLAHLKINMPSDDELSERTRRLDVNQREVLNIGIKFAKDVVKARRLENSCPRAPLLMAHGGAGAGKSTVIHTLAVHMQKILQQEDDDVNSPCVIRTAFTGTAAANIDGNTLHAAFGLAFDGKHNSLTDQKRKQKRAELKNLKMIIIDEVSMTKADMLYQIDLVLQEITGCKKPFGNIAIFAFGDMMQLQPVMGVFVFERPKFEDFHVTYQFNGRWEMF